MNPDPDLQLAVPADFDDSDADAQVHPIARLMFAGRTNAEAFATAQDWLSAHNVLVVDVSWKILHDEPKPMFLTIYFNFNLDDLDDQA